MADSFSSFQKPNPFAPQKPKPNPSPNQPSRDDSWEKIGESLKQGLGESLKTATGINFIRGDLQPGQDAKIGGPKPGEKGPEKKAEVPKNVEPGINWAREIVHGTEQAMARDKKDIQKDINDIMVELQKLAASSPEISKHIVEAVGPNIINANKSDKSLVSQLLGFARTLSQKVKNSKQGQQMVAGKQHHALGAPQSQKAKTNPNFWNRVETEGSKFLTNAEHSPSRSGG